MSECRNGVSVGGSSFQAQRWFQVQAGGTEMQVLFEVNILTLVYLQFLVFQR